MNWTANRPGGARLRSLLLAAALPWVLGTAARAQEDPATDIVLEVLREARGSLPRGTAALDPGRLCRARLAGWSCPPSVQQVLDSLELGIGSRAFSHICFSGPRSCRLLGADVLVQVGEPEIDGREAGVWMDVWWKSGRADIPVEHERSRFQLERRGRRWRVVARTPAVGSGG